MADEATVACPACWGPVQLARGGGVLWHRPWCVGPGRVLHQRGTGELCTGQPDPTAQRRQVLPELAVVAAGTQVAGPAAPDWTRLQWPMTAWWLAKVEVVELPAPAAVAELVGEVAA